MTTQRIMANRKRVYQLMKKYGIKAMYPDPNTSQRNHKGAF